jgi:hypothetical protein
MDHMMDLTHRWRENGYVFNGQNPYDVFRAYRGQEVPSGRDASFHPRYGPTLTGGYPPWSFFTGLALVLPADWDVTVNYFAFVNLLAVGVTAVWAYRLGRPQGVAAGVFLAAAILAVFSHQTTLRQGQYGIIVNALLIGMFWCLESRKPFSAGLFYGMAVVKPTVSVPFLLVFIARRQYRALAGAAVYGAVACAVVWALTRTNPVEMLRDALHESQGYVAYGDGLIRILIQTGGMSPRSATLLLMIGGLVVGGVLTHLYRNRSTLTLFAIAALVGRLWTYHERWDNVTLIFLLAPLAQLALTRPSFWTVTGFLAVGLTLCVPAPSGSPTVLLAVTTVQTLIWCTGLGIVLACDPVRRSEPAGEPASPNATEEPVPAVVDSAVPGPG